MSQFKIHFRLSLASLFKAHLARKHILRFVREGMEKVENDLDADCRLKLSKGSFFFIDAEYAGKLHSDPYIRNGDISKIPRSKTKIQFILNKFTKHCYACLSHEKLLFQLYKRRNKLTLGVQANRQIASERKTNCPFHLI